MMMMLVRELMPPVCHWETSNITSILAPNFQKVSLHQRLSGEPLLGKQLPLSRESFTPPAAFFIPLPDTEHRRTGPTFV